MNIFYKFTWRSLKENKARTIVTLLGIILSVSLITATMTAVSSLYDYMKRVMADEYGSWHLYLDNLTESQVKEIKEDDRINESVVLYNIGYAKLEKSYVPDKPYLYVGGYDGELNTISNLVIKEGRMPQNSSEIILPQALEDSGGVRYPIGDTITLELGTRRYEDRREEAGAELQLFSSYLGEGSSPKEIWEKAGTKEYTVVGKYRSGMFEASYLAGFAGITKADKDMQAGGAAFFSTVKDTDWVTKEGFEEDFYLEHMEWGDSFTVEMNRPFLKMGEYMGFELKALMAGMVIMLILIIALGSVVLIYNSFSLSINERKRQYGLLSSIGATKRQLKKCMLFEAVVLSGVGIPIGILLGMGGISISFYFLKDVFQQFLAGDTTQPVTLSFSTSAATISTAAVAGFLTIRLSVWIPARKAVKISAIEAIRQNDEIFINTKKLQISRLTEKICGLEGTLAVKNFHRNRRRYRTTVFSLFVSIVLFISATSICDYLGKSVGSMADRYDSDLDYRLEDRKDLDRIYDMLYTADRVTKSLPYVDSNAVISVNNSDLTQNTRIQFADPGKNNVDSKIPCHFFFIGDEEYGIYLDKNGYDRNLYMNSQSPVALVYNKSVYYDTGSKKYVITDILEKETISARLMDHGNKDTQMVRTGTACTEVPFGTKGYTGDKLLLFYPMSALPAYEKTLQSGDDRNALTANIALGAEEPDECALRIKKILEGQGENMNNLHNNFDDMQTSIALITVIKVFSNGFVIMILLIALANVFNTIGTSILLRRREFAMLRSIGMTQKGFHRMLNYECLIYGGKGILYGLPAAFLITFAIYQTISGSIRLNFYIPWYAVMIAAGSVLTVVFSTMLYSVHQVNKENVADSLKGDIF